MTLREAWVAIKARASIIGQAVLGWVMAEPVAALTAAYTMVVGLYELVEVTAASGTFDPLVFLPTAAGIVLRFVHLVPGIGKHLGPYSPASVERIKAELEDDSRGVPPEEVKRFFEEMAEHDRPTT